MNPALPINIIMKNTKKRWGINKKGGAG